MRVFNAESRQCASLSFGVLAHDRVGLQAMNLVNGERSQAVGQRYRQERNELSEPEWNRKIVAPASGPIQRSVEQIAEGDQLGTAELVDCVRAGFAGTGRRNCRSNIADVNRLELCRPLPISPRTGDTSAIAASRLNSLSSGPNIIDGRRIMLRGSSSSTALSPASLLRA